MTRCLTRFGIAAIRQKIEILERGRDTALRSAGEAAQNDPNAYHDNFEYEEGMRQQELFSQQLRNLARLLEGATVAPEPRDNACVAIGHYVVIRRPDEPEPQAYVVCGDGEGSLFENACSASSPIGQVLLGMTNGQSRSVSLGGQMISIQVLEIRLAKDKDLQMAGLGTD